MDQTGISALFMRGGTSKGVFFRESDLPQDRSVRDALFLRVTGSPDPYGKHTDGMGSGTSSTSKVVLLGPGSRRGCDVDYCFGAVDIGRPLIDWGGNCGNLTAAVPLAAAHFGLITPGPDGPATIRIWQVNTQREVLATVDVRDGMIAETGDFWLDGVAFPAAEVALEFLNPGLDGADGVALLPTGKVKELLTVPGLGALPVTLMNAGLPTVFMAASQLGLNGTEGQSEVNGCAELLRRAERIRVEAAVAMGLAASAEQVSASLLHVPKLLIVAEPQAYQAAGGRKIGADQVDIVARIFSNGQLHHAMTGTGAVALASAAVVPGTVVSETRRSGLGQYLVFGHASGTLRVGAVARERRGQWNLEKVMLSRSARRLMEGRVFVPSDLLQQRRQ